MTRRGDHHYRLRVTSPGNQEATAISTRRFREKTAKGIGRGSTEQSPWTHTTGRDADGVLGLRHCWIGRFLPGRRVTDFRIRRWRGLQRDRRLRDRPVRATSARGLSRGEEHGRGLLDGRIAISGSRRRSVSRSAASNCEEHAFPPKRSATPVTDTSTVSGVPYSLAEHTRDHDVVLEEPDDEHGEAGGQGRLPRDRQPDPDAATPAASGLITGMSSMIPAKIPRSSGYGNPIAQKQTVVTVATSVTRKIWPRT